jgi:hypothetical protein
MADGDGQRICGIIGMRSVRQTENQADHLLYLGLISFPIANHRLLDLRWGVFRHGDVPLRRGQKDRASRLSNRHCRRHVLSKKKRLNRYSVRSMEIDQLANGGVNHE